MSLINCSCPSSTAIEAIASLTCEEHFGQIQKVILQRSGYTFDGTAGKDITVLADWQTVFAAVDDTKAQITPYLRSAELVAGEKITVGGGDNSTLNGVAELVGVNPTEFTALLRGLTAEIITDLTAYNCESDLVVYFVNKDQKIICKDLGASSYTGIPIQEFFVGDKSNSGYATKDNNAISFSLKDGWSKDYGIVVPAFNPLTAL